jgi:glycosyltransferase involved in cell wall biosynthesis
MKVALNLYCPNDPLGTKVGGDITFLRGLIDCAPEDIELRLIGISSDHQARPPRQWTRLRRGSCVIDFFPLFHERDENRKSLLPLSLRYSVALRCSGMFVRGGVSFFNRLETAFLFRHFCVPKVGIVHHDIHRQLNRKRSDVLWKKFPSLYYLVDRLAVSSMDYIFTVSKPTLQFYRDQYRNRFNCFSFLPTWADPYIFHQASESKATLRDGLEHDFPALSANRTWILYSGRFQEAKAPVRVLESFNEYRRNHPSSQLIMIGEGNLRPKLEERALSLGLEKTVLMPGAQPPSVLARFYQASDLLLLASNFEGMPRSVMEALACGLPVVSTDVGEVRLVVKNGRTGEVVAEPTPRTIASAIAAVTRRRDAYARKHCIAAVANYTPRVVLRPFYEKIRELNRRS